MFTGLVEEKGTLVKKIKTGEGYRFEFQADMVLQDLDTGSSIAVNGCCLTVVNLKEKIFSVDAIRGNP